MISVYLERYTQQSNPSFILLNYLTSQSQLHFVVPKEFLFFHNGREGETWPMTIPEQVSSPLSISKWSPLRIFRNSFPDIGGLQGSNRYLKIAPSLAIFIS